MAHCPRRRRSRSRKPSAAGFSSRTPRASSIATVRDLEQPESGNHGYVVRKQTEDIRRRLAPFVPEAPGKRHGRIHYERHLAAASGFRPHLNEPWPDLLRRSVHGDRPRGLEGDVLQQVSPDSVLLTSPGVAPQLRTRLRPNLRYARKAAEAKAAKAAARWQFTWTSPSLACLR